MKNILSFGLLAFIISCSYPKEPTLQNQIKKASTGPNSIVHKAIEKNDMATMGILIQNGFDINTQIFKCFGVIGYAVHFSSIDFMQYLIDKGADVNARNCQGQTALYFVDAEKAKFLINAGADVNAKDWINKNTPLHEALKIGPTMEKIDINYIKVLIGSGADLNAANKYGLAPLQYFKARLDTLKNKIAPYKELSSPKAHQLDLIKAYNKLKSQEETLTSILS